MASGGSKSTTSVVDIPLSLSTSTSAVPGAVSGSAESMSSAITGAATSSSASTSAIPSGKGGGTLETSSTSSGGGGGLSGGVVAGAAIGAAVGAALIAFLLTFFFCGRRRRPRNEQSTAVMKEKSAPAHPWDTFLPQSADDGKVANAVQSLYGQIDTHVENYYGNNIESALFERSRGYLGMVDSGMLQTPLEQLLPEVRAALPVIKHAFMWFILNKLSPSSSPDETLLPAEYGRLPPRLASSRGGRGEDKTANQAYNYWRVLTAYLMYPNSTQVSNGGDHLGPAGTQCIDVLTTAFAPWAKSPKAGQEHLKSVLKSASDTGLLVLSQSSSFTFEWDVLQREDGTSVVVSPAFVKTADEHGASLSQRQILVKPKVESI